MKRIYFLLTVLLWCSHLSFGQQNQKDLIINRELGQQMEKTFGRLERQRIPHGLLGDAAFPFADLKRYDGNSSEAPMSVDVFGEIYKTLQSARIHESSAKNFKDFKTLADDWNTYRKNYNQDGQIPTLVLSGLYYKYSVFKENALTDGLVVMRDSTLYDVYDGSGWNNPYQEKKVVAMAPPVSTINSLTFNVVLPTDLILGNVGTQAFHNLTIDFKDGRGSQPLVLNQLLNVTYSQTGSYEWEVGLVDNEGNPVYIEIPIRIINPVPPSNITINDGDYGATLRIDYAPNSNGLIKNPLIVVEGFDPESITSPEKIGGSLTLKDFKSSVNNNSQLTNLLNENTQEYDIIYVDWKVGVGDIKRNADVLIKVIDWVNAKKQESGSTATNVVLGQSMGGLVSTYALRKMEKMGKNHDTSLFVAHDSPFQGANTPVSVQFATRQVMSAYMSSPLASTLGEVLIPFLQGLGDMLDTNWFENYTPPSTYLTIQDTPAALQMTQYYLAYNNTITSDFHNNWMTEFRTMGYPQTTRNIAISNGNMCAKPQEIKGRESIIFIDRNFTNSEIKGLSSLGWLLTIFRLYPNGPNIPLLTKILSDREYLETYVDLRALPEQNDSNRLIAKVRMRYRVESSFWFINWTNSVVILPERTLSAPSHLLPLETLPGGNFDVSSIASNLGGNYQQLLNQLIVNPRTGFIPVASALDIGRNDQQALNVDDYRTAFNEETLSVNNAYSTPFANYAVENTVGNFDNFQHISFSAKNSNWLADELNANKNNQIQYPNNCAYMCAYEEISGPDYICSNENYTFSIVDLEEDGVTIQWFASGLNIVSGQGTSSVVVRNSGFPQRKSLQVRISTPCGSVILNKTIHFGSPQLNQEIEGEAHITDYSNAVNNPNVAYMDRYREYSIQEVPFATHYEWVLPGNYVVLDELSGPSVNNSRWELKSSTAQTNAIEVKTNMITDGEIKVRACNDCGCSNYVSMHITHDSYSGGDYIISPNPISVGNELSISLATSVVPSYKNNSTQVKIFDFQMQLRHQFTIENRGGSTDISHLSNGLYKVVIDKQNGTVETHNLSINR